MISSTYFMSYYNLFAFLPVCRSVCFFFLFLSLSLSHTHILYLSASYLSLYPFSFLFIYLTEDLHSPFHKYNYKALYLHRTFTGKATQRSVYSPIFIGVVRAIKLPHLICGRKRLLNYFFTKYTSPPQVINLPSRQFRCVLCALLVIGQFSPSFSRMWQM